MMKKAWILLALSLATKAHSETDAPARRAAPTGLGYFVNTGSIYNFEADLGEASQFSVHHSYIEGGLAYLFRADRMLSFSIGYGQDDYDFSDALSAPWQNIDSYRASVFCRWGLNEDWVLFAGPSIRSYAERGTDLDDAITGAFFGGASYRFSDRLTMGPGLGVVGQLAEETRYFPVLIVDWKITDAWRLGTGGGLAATAGPGLTLSYQPGKHWNYALTGRYESKRFRLNNEGPHPNGVGEDSSVPLVGSVSYILYPGTQLSALFGYNMGGSLLVEDASGNRLDQQDYEAAPFVGLVGRIRF